MSNKIKVGDWTLTPTAIERLGLLKIAGDDLRRLKAAYAGSCCELIGIDPNSDSVARDICEEIVLHGTPVDEVIAKLQRHLEGGQ
jgi:hypothetical protein